MIRWSGRLNAQRRIRELEARVARLEAPNTPALPHSRLAPDHEPTGLPWTRTRTQIPCPQCKARGVITCPKCGGDCYETRPEA